MNIVAEKCLLHEVVAFFCEAFENYLTDKVPLQILVVLVGLSGAMPGLLEQLERLATDLTVYTKCVNKSTLFIYIIYICSDALVIEFVLP